MTSNEELTLRAKYLRKNATDAENLLWYSLKNRQLNGYKFRRQVPIYKYVADFVCEKKKLIVEVDGSQHIDFNRSDLIRTRFLEKLGYRVIRFWNRSVLLETESVLTAILNTLEPS